MQKKKVLILTYYWPPAGGIGVQRWLKFVKYLSEFGWDPVVYTSKNTNFPILDPNLINQVPKDLLVYKLKVPEPNNWINQITFWRSNKNENIYKNQQQERVNSSIIKRFLWFIRGNFFIPDARCFWIKPSIKYLRKIIKHDKFDAIISSGPPHSVHLIGKKLKDEFNIPWISDFRDPWTSMDYLNKMSLLKFAKKKHARLEKEVLENSTKVIVVGHSIHQEFINNYNIESNIIWNGFENQNTSISSVELDEKFSIVHVGSFLFNRNCNDLWSALAELSKENEVFRDRLEIKLIGNVASNVMESINKYGLNDQLNKIDYVEHEKAMEYQNTAQVLLLPIDRIYNAEFVITGKMFEYLKAKRPILLLGPDFGDAAKIISDCNAGYCCNFDDKAKIKETLLEMFGLYTENKNHCHSRNIEQYSMRNLTKKLSKLLDSIILNQNT